MIKLNLQVAMTDTWRKWYKRYLAYHKHEPILEIVFRAGFLAGRIHARQETKESPGTPANAAILQLLKDLHSRVSELDPAYYQSNKLWERYQELLDKLQQ